MIFIFLLNVTCLVANARSYQSHLRRDHAEFNLHSPIQVYGVNGEQSRREEEEISMEVTGHEPDIDESLYDELEVRLDEKKRNDALFLLQTKEANRFTQKATNSVMDNVTTLVRNTVEILRMGVQNRLDSRTKIRRSSRSGRAVRGRPLHLKSLRTCQYRTQASCLLQRKFQFGCKYQCRYSAERLHSPSTTSSS